MKNHRRPVHLKKPFRKQVNGLKRNATLFWRVHWSADVLAFFESFSALKGDAFLATILQQKCKFFLKKVIALQKFQQPFRGQWGGIFLATYLMEIVAVYLAVPSSGDDDDYLDDDEGSEGSGKKRKKLPRLKRKF